jgi:hypothetical protein
VQTKETNMTSTAVHSLSTSILIIIEGKAFSFFPEAHVM